MVSRAARLIYLRRKMARCPTVKEGTWAPDYRDSRVALGAQSQSGIFGEKEHCHAAVGTGASIRLCLN